jgi:arylformamidase
MPNRRVYDISEPISEEISHWPSDSPFSRDWVMRIDQGMPCNVSTIRMSTHCGTHVDSPFHFLKDGSTTERSPLTPYLGPCLVLDVQGRGEPPVIPPEALDALPSVERILLRTSEEHDSKSFDEAFCSLGPQAAKSCVSMGLKLIGIDTPSMDTYDSKELPSHHILLHGGVAMLENLDLTGVPEGFYELIALPLRIVGSDASPVRAILRAMNAD